MTAKKIFHILALMLAASLSVYAEDDDVARGIVRDADSKEPLPYASVRQVGADGGAIADSRGIFELKVDRAAKGLAVSYEGYSSDTVAIKTGRIRLYDIELHRQVRQLAELVVKKKKYTKRNNPAVEFARRLKNSGRDTDPLRHPYYSYKRYDRVKLGINGFDTIDSHLVRRLPFLTEHIDTSEISGAPVLNLSLKERSASEAYSRNPRKHRSIIHGRKSDGIDELVDKSNTEVIMNELLPAIDLYDSDIKLLRNTFVSPLSAIAPDFYRFYLVDSAAVASDSIPPCILLAFYPRNKSSFGFSGHIYVEMDEDGGMHIRKVDMSVPADINLNFVKALRIEQVFDKADDGTRLIRSDRLYGLLGLGGATPQMYVSRIINYSNHSFVPAADSESEFNGLAEEMVEEGADRRDSSFWAEARTEPMQRGEKNVGMLMPRLRQKRTFYWGEKILKVLVNGYIPTSADSRFDIGPVNTMLSYNSLEGIRARIGGMTTANLSRNIFGRAYVAYGFHDRKWKYYGEAEYSFNEKEYHSREFPVHSLRLTHGYDVDRLGSHYLYTNSDNFVLSLARMSDRRFTYRRITELRYTLELANHFSAEVSAEYIRQEASPYVSFVNSAGQSFGHYNQAYFGVKVRYAPGETFYQSKSYRIPVDMTVPAVTLSHVWSPKGLCGAMFDVGRTELSFEKYFRLSVLGFMETSFSAGHVWTQSPFPDLLIPNANLSYTIQPGSFALMNPMEFINSSYVAWHLTWHLRGALFNLVPGLRRLGLRETVGFHGIYGHLSEKNIPGSGNSLFLFPENAAKIKMKSPYMEISAGIDNIFKVLRVEYVWRLNYRHVPYDIDRSGLRVALHFTF